MYNQIKDDWNEKADEYNQWETLAEDEKMILAFNHALEVAASRVNLLALDDNTIKTSISVINGCRWQ